MSGRNPAFVILYTSTNRHAGAPNHRQNKFTTQFCYIGSEIGWVSTLHLILPYNINSHTNIYVYMTRKETKFAFDNHQANLTARDSRKRSNIIYAVYFSSQTVIRDIIQV